MNTKVLPIGLVCLSLFILLIGCGGSGSGNSYSSDWLGITNDPSSTGSWQIDIRPSAVAINPGQTVSVAVLVKDAFGHPLDAVNVLLSSQLGGTFEDQSGTTAKGWFSTRFTAGASLGTEAITVLAKETMASKSLLVQAAGVKTTAIKIVTSAATTLAGSSISLAVGVTTDGASAERASVLLSSTIPGSFDSESGQTTSGWFSTTFKPDATASGIGTITAMVAGEKSEVSLSVVKQKAAAPQLTISVNPDAIFQGQTAAVIVLAKDAEGFPSTSKVYLSASLNGAFGNNEGTPEDGAFYTEFTAGKEIGSASITVFSVGASASTILSIERADIVMKISPSASKVKVDASVPVSILVTDTYSRPISGTDVYLRAELGCYLTPNSGTTNEDGYLFTEFTASKTAGISIINALTAGATASAQITVIGP